MRMLAAFMSLWMILLLWMKKRPSNICCITFLISPEHTTRVADQQHFKSDPDLDSVFYLKAIRIRTHLFILIRIRIRIRIQLLFKVMGICDHCSIDSPGLYFESLGLLW
jgi:hypothetical protein